MASLPRGRQLSLTERVRDAFNAYNGFAGAGTIRRNLADAGTDTSLVVV